MSKERCWEFIQAALGLHLITDRQSEELVKFIRTSSDPDMDIATLMIARGMITEEQKTAIYDILDQAISFAGNFEIDWHEAEGVDGSEDTLFETTDVKFQDIHVISEHPVLDQATGTQGTSNFAHYTVVGTIGAGGLGRVLHGVDRSMQREVAIKEIIDGRLVQKDKRLLARFLNEARITGQLQHPGIVPVYQIGAKSNGGLFYVMKYVRGYTLEDALKKTFEEPTEPARYKARMGLLDVLIDVCNAMGYAHSKNVIHRDLKPGNVVIGKHGENVILDWGLAKYLSEMDDEEDRAIQSMDVTANATLLVGNMSSDTGNLTMASEILGTPSYMAPEQVESDFGKVDRQSDVYALGVILFQIITGALPYQKCQTVRQLLRNLTSEEPSPDPRVLVPDCPPDLAVICKKAMAKKKEERFPNAGALAEQLVAFRDGKVVSVYHYSRKEMLRRFYKQNKALVIGCVVAVLSVLCGGIASTYFGIDAMRNARAAREAVEIAPELENQSLHRVKALSSELQTMFKAFEEEQKAIVETIERENLTTQEQYRPLLEKLQQKYPIFVGVYYLDMPSGKVIAAVPDSVKSTIGVTVADQDHIKQVAATKKPYLSKMFKAVEGYNGIIFDYPVFRNGELVGIVNAMVKPKDFFMRAFAKEKWMSQVESYRAFVYESDTFNVLFDSSDSEMVGQSYMTSDLTNGMDSFKDFLKGTTEYEYGIGKFATHKFVVDPNSPLVHRLCAWETFRYGGTEWKLVAAILFQEGVGVLGLESSKQNKSSIK